MHQEGVQIFVEVGPKGSLVPLISDILSGRPHLAVPVNVANRSGITQIHHLLASLFCTGVNVNLDSLYTHRDIEVQNECLSTLQSSIEQCFDGECSQQTMQDESAVNETYSNFESVHQWDSPEEGRPGQTNYHYDQEYAADTHSFNEEMPYFDVDDSLGEHHQDMRECEELPGGREEKAVVLRSFLKSMAEFNSQFLATQESVLLEYLEQNRHNTRTTEQPDNFDDEANLYESHQITEGQNLQRHGHPNHELNGDDIAQVQSSRNRGGEGPVSVSLGETDFDNDGRNLTDPTQQSKGIQGYPEHSLNNVRENFFRDASPAAPCESSISHRHRKHRSDFFQNARHGDADYPGENSSLEDSPLGPASERLPLSTRGLHQPLPRSGTEVTTADLTAFTTRRAFIGDNWIESLSLYPFSLDLSKDLFLLDHAIGGITRSSSRGRVYLVPLMVTLEILAEAAAARFPACVVSAVRNVRAYKRIVVDHSSPTNLAVRIKCTHAESNKLVAEIISMRRNANGDLVDGREVPAEAAGTKTERADGDVEIYVQAEIEMSRSHGAASGDRMLRPLDLRPSRFDDASLYGHQAMFHGPRMQSVLQLFTAERFESGALHSRAADDWFADSRDRQLTIDALLLDNASQLVLYHMYEANIPAIALLPFHIDSVEFYDDLQAYHGQFVHGEARLVSLSRRGTHADLEVSSIEGRLLFRITGIHSRAIILSPLAQDFVHAPDTIFLSSEIPVSQFDFSVGEQAQGRCSAVIMKVVEVEIPEDETALLWLSDYILNPAEKKYLPSRTGAERRRREWILGRIAAKDAIRICLERQYGIKVCPADIAIIPSESGAPVVLVEGLPPAFGIPQVSIAHCDQQAVAIATVGSKRPGIDLERIVEREEGFRQIAFTSAERQLLECSNMDLSAALKDAVTWAVKESVAKCTGQGLQRVDHVIVEQLHLHSTPQGEFGKATVLVSSDQGIKNVSVRVLDNFVLAFVDT